MGGRIAYLWEVFRLCVRVRSYAVQLLTPGNILRRVNTKEKIGRDEIQEIRDLYASLQQQQHKVNNSCV